MWKRNFAVPSDELGSSATRQRVANSRAGVSVRILVALLALGGTWGGRSAELPERSEVNAVVTTLRADPDLKTTRRAKMLQFRRHEPEKPQELPPWWTRLLRWSRAA